MKSQCGPVAAVLRENWFSWRGAGLGFAAAVGPGSCGWRGLRDVRCGAGEDAGGGGRLLTSFPLVGGRDPVEKPERRELPFEGRALVPVSPRNRFPLAPRLPGRPPPFHPP
jgi:hypothetical protein